MSMTGNKFRLGLFFVVGVLFTVFLIIWLSGGLNERRTTTYVSYFTWSVQGLNEGSGVMYNGVSIGRIASIDIAPDGRLVEVVMKIRPDFVVDSQIVAVMQLTGITGLSVINLSPDSTRRSVQTSYSFEVVYPEIPVKESALQSATSLLTRMTEIVNEVDFRQISESSIALLQKMNTLLDSEMIEKIELAILSNSANLDTLLTVYTRLGRNLDRLVLTIESVTPDLAGDVSFLAEELRELAEPLGILVRRMDEVMIESSEMLGNLSAFLEIIRNNPGELFIKTSGEGVWR